MNKFAFISSAVFLSAISSAILGGILGYFYAQFNPDHAHQIIPTWMILAVVGFVSASAIALLLSIYHIYKKTEKPSLSKIILVSSVICFLLNVVLVYCNFTR